MISANNKSKRTEIDEFISRYPENIQKLLSQLRSTIKKAAPEASEKISYGIPTFYLHGNLVHFSAYKNHLGFYPTSSGVKTFKEELVGYKCAKGSIQFPVNKPLPIKLISNIVKFRVNENLNKIKLKQI
jgi:uncharacterized protein YdhG (YjbR/CyaY superfamily)